MNRLRPVFRVAAVSISFVIVWIVVGIVLWPRIDALPNETPSAVIALSAGVKSDSALNDAGVKRLTKAVSVARQFHAQLFTTRVFERGQSSDGGERRIVAQNGWDAQWRILPGLPKVTRDEALLLRAALPGAARVAVVTSPMHTRRACATFEHLGFRVTCIASRQSRWWLVPYEFVYEQLAMIKYRVKGWLAG